MLGHFVARDPLTHVSPDVLLVRLDGGRPVALSALAHHDRTHGLAPALIRDADDRTRGDTRV